MLISLGAKRARVLGNGGAEALSRCTTLHHATPVSAWQATLSPGPATQTPMPSWLQQQQQQQSFDGSCLPIAPCLPATVLSLIGATCCPHATQTHTQYKAIANSILVTNRQQPPPAAPLAKLQVVFVIFFSVQVASLNGAEFEQYFHWIQYIIYIYI